MSQHNTRPIRLYVDAPSSLGWRRAKSSRHRLPRRCDDESYDLHPAVPGGGPSERRSGTIRSYRPTSVVVFPFLLEKSEKAADAVESTRSVSAFACAGQAGSDRGMATLRARDSSPIRSAASGARNAKISEIFGDSVPTHMCTPGCAAMGTRGDSNVQVSATHDTNSMQERAQCRNYL